ncbi:MAG: Glycosyltransferase [Parcubacteria group bacterium GW2011_GWB1_41_4]|nr:MAG: Glycosyltransferase [Parcubacteria group bacterium GW2011_GWB1_41_4]
MKLIVITQKVDINDDNLSFFHRWLEKLSGKVERLFVVCLAEGEHHLPKNTTVYSLGKERGYSKIRQLFRLQKFLLKNLPEADGVFVHMCPIYAVASWPLVKIFRKKMILWFLHRNVSWKLKLAEKCVAKILTASEESCRLKNRKKIEIVGHGIDTDFFKPAPFNVQPSAAGKLRIISVGRISPIKDQETLIRAIDILFNQKNIKDIEVKFFGTPLEKYERIYLEELKDLVKQKQLEGCIEFLGGVSNNEMPEYYQNADLVVNLSHTGSIDKVMLEAMACAIPVLTCNEAFRNILGEKYLFEKKNPQDLAEKIINLRAAGKDTSLREIVVKYHNLDNLIGKIIAEF